ncbi:MAG: zinc-ribbon domain-containing protein [Myxococcaceae bacterium]|nr:zinc-ribbon domain-containing protein [Myxococcaceae bacterium]
MNFSCDKCQRRYSIADEKVRGKTVKVRCKNCQNVISVQGPPAEMEESTRVVSLADVERIREQERAVAAASSSQAAPPGASPWEDEPTRAAPARPASAPWFVMVKSKQEGPLDEAGLQELVQSGAVNGRSFFWQQGMADWKRGAEIPELAAIFAPPAPAQPPAPVMVPEPATASMRGSRGAAAPARAQGVPAEHGWDDVPTTVGQAAMSREPWDLDPPASEQPQRQAQPQQAAWDEPEPQQAAWDEPEQQQSDAPWDEQAQPQQAQAAWDEPEQPAARARSNAGVGDDLFSDLDLPDRNEQAELGEPPTEIHSDADPLAAVRGGKGGRDDKKPVEDTRHFMMKSGVTKRNPVWKVALFILAPIFLVVGTLYVLSTLKVVPLNVTTVNAQGQKVEKSVFSGEGVSALRDRLMGRSKPPPAPVAQPPADKRPNGAGAKPEAGSEEAKPAAPETGKSAEEIKALYGDGSKQDMGPEVRKDSDVAAKDAAGKGGPPPEDIKKVVDKSQGAIQGCVETELRKNPSFKGGKVLLVATVGTSGTVKSAKLDRKELDASPVGDCIKKSARRMVFPRFKAEDGVDEVDLEIPLVLSSGAM